MRPTVFAAVPRIWEMLHDGIVGHALKAQGWRGTLLRQALRLAGLVGGGRARLDQKVLHAGARALVLKKVLATSILYRRLYRAE